MWNTIKNVAHILFFYLPRKVQQCFARKTFDAYNCITFLFITFNNKSNVEVMRTNWVNIGFQTVSTLI